MRKITWWIGLLIGLFAGGAIGVMFMALLQGNKINEYESKIKSLENQNEHLKGD